MESKTWVAEGNFVWMTSRYDGRKGEASLLLVLPQKSMLLVPSIDIYMVDHSMIEGREGGDDNGTVCRRRSLAGAKQGLSMPYPYLIQSWRDKAAKRQE